MKDEVGPQKFLDELRDQAPRYAKLLPELPHLIHKYLRERSYEARHDYRELMSEIKRMNRLLQTLIYAGVGFAAGLLVVQLLLRLRGYS
jgi:ubiquinone biosynthesis protein